VEPSPDSPAGKLKNPKPPTLDPKSYPYAKPQAKPSLYSQGVLGKPTAPPPEPGLKEWTGGDFKSPETKPSLYSQGIMGKPKSQPPAKIGEGLIGEGALFGGPYKMPIDKPSLYSQGFKDGRGWSYVVGGPFVNPKPSEKTVDVTGMKSTRNTRGDFWVNLLWGGPYKKPSPGYGDPAVPPTAPAEEASEQPILDEPTAGDAALAEETGPSILAISFWAFFGVVLGSGTTMMTVRFFRPELPADGQEPLMTV